MSDIDNIVIITFDYNIFCKMYKRKLAFFTKIKDQLKLFNTFLTMSLKLNKRV